MTPIRAFRWLVVVGTVLLVACAQVPARPGAASPRAAALSRATQAVAAPAPRVQSCAAASAQASTDPRTARWVAQAMQEHAAFGGQQLDADGRMTKAGIQEAETDALADGSGPAWRRVLAYWQALDPGKPRDLRGTAGGIQRLAPLLAALDGAGKGDGADPGLSSLDDGQRLAIRTALQRAALVDNPWSAAFVSYLARSADMADEEFAYSDAHHVYVAQAFDASRDERAGTPSDAAFRACAIARTTPRPGDMVCQTRGSGAELDRFAAVETALAERGAGGAFPMHCDLVVDVDLPGGYADTIGGNVLQSVTRRRMALEAGPPATIARRYFHADAPAGCVEDPGACGAPFMSFQPWTVLLQVRR
ncbi:DUF2272 domain-containing protein [Xylophilus ampelinus]|uniref:DUF2272 domain-containing protein n=1 Tax=Xylophilus ampelinus TaxID=54067 RepID=A0A318SJB9_9BURK|nr:DUF2272 domain-containing protein [Xylophilus ampelinus]MCS4509552.1 DUF2272 domain-containing protein [Xylophilus ampelinus]PYE78968.1 hypothetical protein DFQ15_104162 [Xylophilus ampelinus]